MKNQQDKHIILMELLMKQPCVMKLQDPATTKGTLYWHNGHCYLKFLFLLEGVRSVT